MPRVVRRSGGAAASRLWQSVAVGLPAEVVAELKVSIRRLIGVRRLRDLPSVLEAEVGRLSRVVVPALARHPLPIRRRRTAVLLAATIAAAAAALVELDELAVLFTDGVAAPTVPAAGASLLVAFVAELWIAVSLRVHQVGAAGRRLDMDLLASEVSSAVLDVDVSDVRELSGRVATAVGKRVVRRWAGALAPGVGIVIDGTAARRTIAVIAAMSFEGHPMREPTERPSYATSPPVAPGDASLP